jgi:hypothetical protein
LGGLADGGKPKETAPAIADGPLESKEVLAGCWIVDVKTPQRAYELPRARPRRQDPAARRVLPIEVHPVKMSHAAQNRMEHRDEVHADEYAPQKGDWAVLDWARRTSRRHQFHDASTKLKEANVGGPKGWLR